MQLEQQNSLNRRGRRPSAGPGEHTLAAKRLGASITDSQTPLEIAVQSIATFWETLLT